jgi:hypothetical protein
VEVVSWFNKVAGAARRTRRVKRAAERFPTDLLTTELGEVADLSGHGMRLRTHRGLNAPRGLVLPLTIRWSDFRVTVNCRVVRSGRSADGGAEIGVAFVDPSPRLRAALEHLGRFGFVPGADAATAEGSGATRHGRGKAPPDHYKVLGVSPEASAAEIRQAYHRLSRQYHPDLSRDPTSARKFQALAEAYRALRDAEDRRRYDAARAGGVGAA